MPLLFGKYKGCALSDVPTDYLRWLVERHGLHETTRHELQAELFRRSAANRDQEETKAPPPNPALDRRLTRAGWLRSSAGYWSRWFDKTRKRPGWALYQVSRPLAVVVQNYLDQAQARERKRRAA